MAHIKYYGTCPYCGKIAIRVTYAYDSTERYAVYYCDECGGTFTMVYKNNDKGSGHRR